VNTEKQHEESFVWIFLSGVLISFSPFAGILFHIEPVPLLGFLMVAMSIWIAVCVFVWAGAQVRFKTIKNSKSRI
jgi:hypothetical protein